MSVNKRVADARGTLYEMMPHGTDNELVMGPIGNIYASKATVKHQPRAGHYHEQLDESFFMLSGTAIWYFEDFRKDSSTFGKTYAVLIGENEEVGSFPQPKYSIEDGILHVRVPRGVYHIYFPLTSEPVLVIAVSSRPYDAKDYFYPLKDNKKILAGLLKKGSAKRDNR